MAARSERRNDQQIQRQAARSSPSRCTLPGAAAGGVSPRWRAARLRRRSRRASLTPAKRQIRWAEELTTESQRTPRRKKHKQTQSPIKPTYFLFFSLLCLFLCVLCDSVVSSFSGLFLLAGFLFLLGSRAFGDGFGLLAVTTFLLAEDGFIALSEFLGFREADSNNTHVNFLLYWCANYS